MRNLLILGAGTAGTMMVNKLHRRLDLDDWHITIVDRDPNHYYQPGFLFIPFGLMKPDDVVRPKADFIPRDVETIFAEIDRIEPDAQTVALADGRTLAYDVLIVATGVTPRPEETPGLEGKLWRRDAFDFYTFDGASALAQRLATWNGGRLVINMAEAVIKCPVAPLEFAFLADHFFTQRGLRDRVEILYVTPLAGAFTKPIATAFLSDLLQEKGITVVPDFYLERVDEATKTLHAYDGREVAFDLLVSVPTNMGDDLVERSDMGDDDELNLIPTDRHTLQAVDHPEIFVIGDATNLPTSKAGSVAHFEADILLENVLAYIDGKPLPGAFDGHANCFIETGGGRAALIDFNYEVEPLPGKFPLPIVGPFDLLKTTRRNHLGKLGFEWAYWNLLLKGHDLPVPSALSMRGKQVDAVA